MTACRTPWLREPDCRLRKNETVIGIMGKTQGVKIAANPNPNATRRNRPRPSEAAGPAAGAEDEFPDECRTPASRYPAGALTDAAGAAGSMIRFADAVFFLGGRHMVSLQAW